MKTIEEVRDYLQGCCEEQRQWMTALQVLRIGAFLLKNKVNVLDVHTPIFLRFGSEQDNLFDENEFKAWFFDCTPKFKVGDKVSVIRESHPSEGVITKIEVITETKPRGCFCWVKNEEKGTVQKVNQNKLLSF